MNRPPAFEFIPARYPRPAPVHLAGRGLHRAHFAFMRAVLQGLDPALSWRRYLAGPDDRVDLRLVRSAMQWVRDEFAAAALRERRPGTARLVLLDPGRWSSAGSPVPSLDAFAAAEGLDGFSQNEQLEAYAARFGAAASRQRRAQRLVHRQLEALRWLETLSAPSPRLADPLTAWLHPGLAARLSAAGVQTLGDLVERIKGHGVGWHRGIAAIGVAKATRIVRWVRMHEGALGVSLGDHTELRRSHWTDAVRAQASETGPGVRPLEKLVLPPALDGHAGEFRAPASRCRLPAADDLAAVRAWLGPAPDTTAPEDPTPTPRRPAQTYRAYRKEAERLLLWATVERHKPLSSLDADDVQAYLAFLDDPQPRARWCGPASAGRWSDRWRPWVGPLSPASKQHAVRVLRALFTFLQAQGYLRHALFQQPAVFEEPAAGQVPQAIDKKQTLTFSRHAPAELAWRAALYEAARSAGWRLRQLCEARWCDLSMDPAQPGTWLVQRPPGASPRSARRTTAPLRLSTTLLLHGAALVGLAPGTAGTPISATLPLVPASHRWPGQLRPTGTPPTSGILPGTLRDQLRDHGRL